MRERMARACKAQGTCVRLTRPWPLKSGFPERYVCKKYNTDMLKFKRAFSNVQTMKQEKR